MFVGGSVRCPAYSNEVVSVETELLATFQERSEQSIRRRNCPPRNSRKAKVGAREISPTFCCPAVQVGFPAGTKDNFPVGRFEVASAKGLQS